MALDYIVDAVLTFVTQWKKFHRKFILPSSAVTTLAACRVCVGQRSLATAISNPHNLDRQELPP
jgi:hypothetical protein